MLFRCFLLLFCITAITAQKGGRKASASETSPVARAAALAGRKTPQPSEPIQQVQEPDREPAEDTDASSGLRPTRPKPAEEGEGEGHYPAPEPYSFSYSVEDPESGAASSREETQDASGEIVGYYHIKDQDGRTRRVDYTAGKDGFKATIKSNEEGLNSRAPADVKVELSAAPSERVLQYAPNNRPQASESSIKSFGKPVQSKFYQKLLPTSTTRLPPPPPPPEETQDSQTYESQNDPEITQQQNLEEDEQQIPFESLKGSPQLPQTQPPPTVSVNIQRYQPTSRPVGTFTPVRSQVYREQGLVQLQPVRIQPQVQYQEDIPQNSIEEVQQTLELPPSPPSPPAPTQTYQFPPQQTLPPPRPQLPQRQVLQSPQPLPPPPPQRPLQPLQPLQPIRSTLPPPRKSFTPSLPRQTLPPPPAPVKSPPQTIQYRSSVVPPPPPPPVQQQQTADLAPLPPPSNNIIFAQQHREPITQQQLLQFFQPLNNQPLLIGSTPQQPIVFDASPPRAINLFSSLNNDGQTLMAYLPPQVQQQTLQQTPQQLQQLQPPQSNQDYRFVVHREQDTYQLPPQLIQPQSPRQEVIAQEPEQVQESIRGPPPPPPPPPVSLPPPPRTSLPPPPPRPLPTPPPAPRRQVFEPQVYEPPSQQTYEPLQQVYEPPQQTLDDAVRPQKCECQQRAEQTQSYAVKGAGSEPAPVKGGRSSPSRNLNLFLPQAFRTRRDSTAADSDSAMPSGIGRAQFSIQVIDPKSEANEERPESAP